MGESEAPAAVQALLQNIASWLKPGGLLFVHIFTHKSLAYHFEVRCTPLWPEQQAQVLPSSPTAFVLQYNARQRRCL